MCPEGYYWNEPAQECKCWPQICAINRSWDSRLCMCVITPLVCAENERWDSHLGVCVKFTDCLNEFEFFGTYGYRDSETDDCICADSGFCFLFELENTSTFYWDHNTCECVHSYTECPEGQYLDTITGTCKYYASCECSIGSQFDQVTGECSCIPQVCPEGFYYRVDLCSCECFPTDCDLDRYFDAATCSCECENRFCGSLLLNTKDCSC
ncbi:MAG: hypothetical protein ACK521_12635 [bacterium]